MRRAKRITALAVAAAMVLSNVAYAAPDTNTTTTQQGAESLNSQSDASGGVKDQASDTKGNTSTSASQSKEQVKQNESSQSTDPDPGDQKQTDSKEDVVSQNQDEDSTAGQTAQSTDDNAPKDTQESSKNEEEKVFYDITFETPEKHGKIIDMDGKEVIDGKTLKTDENGKVKFKVKPDDGYQAQAVYQMPDEQTPLKLVKDSYYEMQVEKNTAVKVIYQKIPAKNDSEDGGEDNSQKAEDVNTEDQVTEETGNQGNESGEDDGVNTSSDQNSMTEFKVSFESEEPHGTIYDAEGNKITDDAFLLSDENGKVEFTIQVDEGYQVDQVFSKESEISHDEEDVYSFYAKKDTVVFVSYSIIKTQSNALAIRAQDYETLYIGDKAEVKCNHGGIMSGYKHDWKSSNPNYVSVTTEKGGFLGRQKDTQNVTAKQATNSPVTITCDGEVIATYIVKEPSDRRINIRFDLNGGQGTKPETIEVTGDDDVKLPTGDGFSRTGYKFLGWSESKQGGMITSKGNSGYQTIYPGGDLYSSRKDVTLYAIWAQTEGELSDYLWITTRNDGTVPAEPANQSTGSYTQIGDMWHYRVNNILDWISPAQTAVGNSNVLPLLTDHFFQYVREHAKIDWDKQYIEWYVIKYETMSDTEGWHIDGVIRNIENYYVDYSPNTSGYTGLWPDGQEYKANSNVKVEKAGRFEDGQWKELQRPGYEFTEWNTKPDGTGISYQPGESFTLTKDYVDANHAADKLNTVTLYAQWKLKNSVKISYAVAGNKGGSVNPQFEILNPDTGEAKGSTAKAAEGYKFVGWYNNEECTGAPVSTNNKYIPSKPENVWKETTYYAKFVEKEGIAGYNLGGGNWTNGIPNGLEDNSSGTSPKYPYKTKFEYGDRFTVINDIPVKAGDVFLGWYQKKAGENNSAIVHAGDTVMYPYKEPNRYTLDALWANLEVKGDTVLYDGEEHQVTNKITFNNSLPPELEIEARKLLQEGKVWYRYSQDGGKEWTDWNNENPEFVNAGTYTVQVKQEVTVDQEKTRGFWRSYADDPESFDHGHRYEDREL